MSLEAWLVFCVTETVLCFTPGPAVLCVVSVAVARGLRPGLGAATGVLTANAVYFAVSASGVAAALTASRELFVALKWAGAVYLVWIGLRMLRTRHSAAGVAPAPAFGHSFVRGFVVQGANPKAFVFFVALLPQFIDPTGPLVAQTLVLGVSSIVIELLALALYALGAARARRAAGGRFAAWLERLGGGLLIAAGARLATARSQ